MIHAAFDSAWKVGPGIVDVSWNHVGDREMLWLDMTGSHGSAGIGPLRVFKEINGKPVNVTPTGASGRENAFTISYRAELAHFVAAVKGDVEPAGLDDISAPRIASRPACSAFLRLESAPGGA